MFMQDILSSKDKRALARRYSERYHDFEEEEALYIINGCREAVRLGLAPSTDYQSAVDTATQLMLGPCPYYSAIEEADVQEHDNIVHVMRLFLALEDLYDSDK